MRFRDVQHQERALSIVRRALVSGRMHHAYLFEGPPGVGKELTARALAASLLCEAPNRQPDADACGRCRACRLFAAGNHPDFHLIHRGLHKLHPERTIRTSKGLFLVVDIIRHFLIEPASTTPNLGRRRVFLIRDAERMNEGAQNALLKTIEEPPGSACLILVTSSAERLLPTIRSRCQRVPFDLLPSDYVEKQLRALAGVEPEAACALAAIAQGRLGAALHWHRIGLLTALSQVSRGLASRLADDPETFGRALLEIAGELAVRTVEETGNFADEQASAPDDAEAAQPKAGSKTVETDELRDALKLVLLLVAAIYRDALVAQSACDTTLRALPRELDAVEGLARGAAAGRLAETIEAVATAEWMLDRNVAPQLACEHLAVALSGGLPTV
ncbi:MAG: DNA polymerase III subunit delta' [Phycisphaerae bacterium]